MRISLLLLLFTLTSCAKMNYVVEQGLGQLSLEYNGEDNKEILEDPKVKEEYKEKIRKITQYKKFFYQYFDKEPTPIYEETTFLKQKAVTYLVIASAKTKIEPVMTSFPFVGEFPYLGFFERKSAKDYKKKLEEKGFSTYMRPVYAYTTLNKLPFYDNIISSFFQYNEQQLTETIFHELIHTVFFIEDEIDFNESLADYFGKLLSFEYFNYNEQKKKKLKNKLLAHTHLMQKLAHLIQKLNSTYEKQNKLTDQQAKIILNDFVTNTFKPQVTKLCKKEKIEKCWPVEQKWNNAKFAAFMTYTKEQNLIEKLHHKKKFNLKELLTYLENKYKKYQDSDVESFALYLKQKEKL